MSRQAFRNRRACPDRGRATNLADETDDGRAGINGGGKEFCTVVITSVRIRHLRSDWAVNHRAGRADNKLIACLHINAGVRPRRRAGYRDRRVNDGACRRDELSNEQSEQRTRRDSNATSRSRRA